LRSLVADARPIVEVLIETEVARAGDDVHARGAAADAVLEVLAELTNPVLVDGYARRLAERLGVDPRALGERLATVRRNAGGARGRAGLEARGEDAAAADHEALTVEQFVLRLLLLHPDSVDAIAAEDFGRADARAVFEGVRAAVAGGAVGTAAVLEALAEPLQEEARSLVAWGADMAEVPVEAREVAAAVKHLRLLNRYRELALIGGRRADLEGAGERGGWAEDAGRVGALLAEIRKLEREGGPLTASWATVLRAEASPGQQRS
jgi:DNA primase